MAKVNKVAKDLKPGDQVETVLTVFEVSLWSDGVRVTFLRDGGGQMTIAFNPDDGFEVIDPS